MRIISGIYRGKHIPVPRHFKARPTTDFAKEGLFNVLANHYNFEELSVLDLFAGSGSISYEFASRGTPSIDMVEINPGYLAFIRKTTASLQFKQIRVIRSDAFHYISHCRSKYDLIFADPPYQLTGIKDLPDLIFDAELLNQPGWFILEHNRRYSFADHPEFREMRHYGNVHFSIFERR